MNQYSMLVRLNLSMNKIQSVESGFDACPNLRSLTMSDNLMLEISPLMFYKCKSLRHLNLDLNKITKIQNLGTLTDLTELSLQNN